MKELSVRAATYKALGLLLLALVFGLIGWRERTGRVVAIVSGVLLAVIGLVSFVSKLYRAGAIEQPAQKETTLDRAKPVESRSFAVANAAETHTAGDFVEYSVNKTWAELGDMFDLSTPERAVGSFGIRAATSTDFAALLNKATIGLPRQPEGSWK